MEADNRTAHNSACQELTAMGFKGGPNLNWIGELDCGEHGLIEVRVDLPPGFPSELPRIYIDRKSLPHRIPHVEKSGKVCIAPDSGILIDISRPDVILHESLAKAAETISSGFAKTNQPDLVKEYLAYWDDSLKEGVVSICTADGPTRPIFWGQVSEWTGYKNASCLVSDDRHQAERWSGSFGKTIHRLGDAFFIHLETSPLPPDFDDVYTVRNVLDIAREHAGTESTKQFDAWLAESSLPATVIFSIPLPSDLGRALAGIQLPRAYGAAARESTKSYKKIGKVPASRQLEFSLDHKAPRLFVVRLDTDYLVPRSGGTLRMKNVIVSIVGCGSVGSHVIEALAKLGVGELRIIDHDTLKPENIHRHVLGLEFVGFQKATAMQVSLSRRYPHLLIKGNPRRIQEVLKDQPSFVNDSHLVVIALGDENQERVLNELMMSSKPRVHVWVEPLGIAQHVLVTGLEGGGGCYECLFESDENMGVINRSALAAPGQNFQRSFAGCGGSFATFSAMDAGHAANLAATVATNFLTGTLSRNFLMSRRGDQSTFVQAGYELSKRGMHMKSREVSETTEFQREGCRICK